MKVENKKSVQIQRHCIRIHPSCIPIAELIGRYGTTMPMPMLDIDPDQHPPVVVKLSATEYRLVKNYLAFIRQIDQPSIKVQIDKTNEAISDEMLIRTIGLELCDLFVRQRKIEPEIEQMIFEQSELIFGEKKIHEDICALGGWSYDDLKNARRLRRVKTDLPAFSLADYLYSSGLPTKGVYNEF
ncbi:hypothetical protein SAMN02745664_11340 [Moraxella cuniculi DSM 21768]|uniref:Uncharacterized protein n=1 Tax=Moraxella cuniculi DSM 21768 TaxID=1122245 RepID=A0A1N7FIU0_9GAMM|nr:hypothetical protein [Moraxella cuniculi]OOS02248.1 hypothetical protein B0189_10285 [Moraxella cuniculi]SIS00243.1 hypothetical protein SAMN02745664_11340 [Moraxella cuniculi DSM 21768]